MKDVDPGEMDQRIAIETQTTTADGMGGGAIAWTAGASFWAKVRPMTGNERSHAQQIESPATYVVITRTRTITENQRLKWVSNGNLILNIRHIARSPRDLYMKLEVEMGVST